MQKSLSMLVFIITISQPQLAFSNNSYPFVFLHGFFGWGESELGPLKYYGGLDEDLITDLNQHGRRTIAVSMGPLSSNWDRAVEAYYYLKGGRVDYGAAHAKKHGHSRWGRYFPGALKEWGQEESGAERVHMIGHSQGTQTARLLAHLLAHGDEEERDYHDLHGGQISPLFEGGKAHWVRSLVSHAGAMDGTTLASAVKKFLPFITHLVGLADLVLQKSGLSLSIYDLKLDQWKLSKLSNESTVSYLKRFISSSFHRTTDHSLYDLSPEGAAHLNSKTRMLDDVYYFSYAISATNWSDNQSRHKPIASVSPLFKPFAHFLGSCLEACEEDLQIDHSWLENDSVVNTRSMVAPSLGKEEPYFKVSSSDQFMLGAWNHVRMSKHYDHMQIVGFGNPSNEPILPLYLKLAQQLSGLPQ